MKQTAINWLEDKVIELGEYYEIPNEIFKYIEKAKEMEKEQIEKAVIFGNRQDFYDGTEEIGNNYYNETFKIK